MGIKGSEADAQEVYGFGMVDGVEVVVDVVWIGVGLVVEVLGLGRNWRDISFGAGEGLFSVNLEAVEVQRVVWDGKGTLHFVVELVGIQGHVGETWTFLDVKVKFRGPDINSVTVFEVIFV